MFTNGEIITASRLVDKLECNTSNGYCGLNISGLINSQYLPTYVYWNADSAYVSSVLGTWTSINDVNQTDGDLDFVSGYYSNVSSHCDLDEITWPIFKLISGKYNIDISYVGNTNTGIIEVLHGSYSLGTKDTWNFSGVKYNETATFNISCCNRTQNFRLRVNSKNTSSLISNFIINVSKLEVKWVP